MQGLVSSSQPHSHHARSVQRIVRVTGELTIVVHALSTEGIRPWQSSSGELDDPSTGRWSTRVRETRSGEILADRWESGRRHPESGSACIEPDDLEREKLDGCTSVQEADRKGYAGLWEFLRSQPRRCASIRQGLPE